jgi:hypothetical protein
MDVLAVTDFPDYRMKAVIQSVSEGALLVPRAKVAILCGFMSSSTRWAKMSAWPTGAWELTTSSPTRYGPAYAAALANLQQQRAGARFADQVTN